MDERALAAEQFKLNRLSAVLPDGSPIEHGEGDGRPRAPARLRHGVPRPGEARSTSSSLSPTRATTCPTSISTGRAAGSFATCASRPRSLDVNTGVGEHNLQYARPNLSLLFGDERKDAFDAIRIAQIIARPDGLPVLARELHPAGAARRRVRLSRRPLPQAPGDPGREAAHARRLAPPAHGGGGRVPGERRGEVLAAQRPERQHPLDLAHRRSRDRPPRAGVPRTWRSSSVTLCTFAVDGDPTTIPKFNYLELGDVFEPMFDRAHKLLEAVLAERFVEIPLTKREDGMFLGQITDSNLLRYTFFLAAAGDGPRGAAPRSHAEADRRSPRGARSAPSSTRPSTG